MGTTGLGFFTPLLVFVLTVLFTLGVIFRRQGKEAMKQHWKQTAAVTTGITLCVMLVVYGPIFSWRVVTTVYSDHQGLISNISNLKDENDKLKERNKELDSKNKQLEDENRKVKDKIGPGRVPKGNSSETALQPLPPPVQDMRIVSQDWIPSTNPQFRYELKVVVQTNVPIHPVSIAFVCDNEISEGSVAFAGDQGEMFVKVRSGVLVANKKVYLASFEEPTFTPEKNMVVLLFSTEPIKVTSFQPVPFRFP